MQVPKLQKICLNIGVGGAVQDPKLLQNAINELELITGQRPTIRKAKNAISNFKLRAGMPEQYFLYRRLPIELSALRLLLTRGVDHPE